MLTQKIEINSKEYELGEFTLGDLYRLEKLLGKPFIELFKELNSLETIAGFLFVAINKKYPNEFENLESLLDCFSFDSLADTMQKISSLITVPSE